MGLGVQSRSFLRMVLVFGDDLRFEDEHGLRSSAVVDRWACELPTNGRPAASSWPSYVGAVSQWSEFGEERAVGPFDSRERLKALLSAYAVYRSQGPADGRQRFRVTTWNQRMTSPRPSSPAGGGRSAGTPPGVGSRSPT